MLEVCAKFENCDGLEESPPVRSFRESTMDIVRAAACAKSSAEINFEGVGWRQLQSRAAQMAVTGLARQRLKKLGHRTRKTEFGAKMYFAKLQRNRPGMKRMSTNNFERRMSVVGRNDRILTNDNSSIYLAMRCNKHIKKCSDRKKK
eukprot:825750_1